MENDILLSEFQRRLAEEIRTIRKASDWTQTNVADLFGWGKSAISKIEKADYNLSLYHYLRIMYSLRDSDPDHPGVELAYRLLGKRQPH